MTTAPSLGLASGLQTCLVSRGWEVIVVSAPGPQLDAYCEADGVTARPLEMRRRPSIKDDLHSIQAWRKILRSERPDVVFYGTPKVSLLASVAGCLERQANRVYILRGLRLEGTRGPKRVFLQAFERLTFACSTSVISVSPSLSRAAVRANVTMRRPLQLFGLGSSNGVDTEAYRPVVGDDRLALRSTLGLREDVPTIGFVGRINRDKGVGDLLEAARELAAGSAKFQLLLLGGNDGSDVSELIESVRASGVHVVAPGHVNMSRDYYALMDILCLPTYREGFPNVVLEASACEVAIVTTEATGARDSVVPGVTGVRVPARSPQRLAAALKELLADPARRTALGRAGRVHVIENYARHQVQERLVDYFDSLVKAGDR
ncbi:glycosyltransferase [Micrococcales bacterium 31B]|nr:glycosyltransferase [Micrococcales bacterium 31B]